MDRREFIAGLPLTLALVAQSCKAPKDKIVPAINPVEYQIPGKAVEFMSVYDFYGIPYGVKITCRDGRPVKIDANPNHPLNPYGISPLIQSEIFELYNPQRFNQAWLPGRKKTSSDKVLTEALERMQTNVQNGIHIVLPLHSSQGLYKLSSIISGKFPQIQFHYFQGFDSESIKVNHALCGFQGDIVPDLNEFSYILSLGSDFLFSDKMSVFHQNQFDSFRSRGGGLVSIEPDFSVTGSLSDQRYSIKPHEIIILIEYLASRILPGFEISYELKEKINSIAAKIPVDDILKKVLDDPSRAILIPAKWQDERTQWLISLINQALSGKENNLNKYHYQDYSVYRAINIINNINELAQNKGFFAIIGLSKSIFSGQNEFFRNKNAEDLLIISNCQPEENCFFIPATHFLESWSDRHFAGQIFSVQQPVISPLIDGSISTEDFIVKLGLGLGIEELNGIDSYYDYILKNYNYDDKGSEWEELLRNGFKVSELRTRSNDFQAITNKNKNSLPQSSQIQFQNGEYDVLILPDIYLFDSNRANNPWLHELPHPVSGISWVNTALISPGTASKLNLENGDIINIETTIKIEIPVYILKGTADDTIIIYDGRMLFINDKEKYITTVFGNNYFRAKVTRSQGKVEIPQFQTMDRNYFRELSNNTPSTSSKRRNWVLSVETDKCIGCHSCVISCQIENNIPYVGMPEINRGRNLHWIKVDIGTNLSDNNIERKYYFPIMCQQCANAPCEPVCPVFASTHSKEGLNETSYNRCIGSRFCMVNCPYKIRKFNYFNYSDNYNEPLNYSLNPNVTVRMRGIVEKCTFCIQRINEANRNAKYNGKQLEKNSIETACQEACPTNSIKLTFTGSNEFTFDKSYSRLLENLNTDPSVLYKTGKGGNGRI